MVYLIPGYIAFSLIVIIRQQKSPNLIWFLLMPVGFCLALSGLLLYTEYISFANFIDNPIIKGNSDYLWRLNYYLNFSIFGMFRLMNLGIALYIVGAVGFPLSQNPRSGYGKKGFFLIMIPAVLILADDPGLIQHLFKPESLFGGMQRILGAIGILNRILNLMVKAALILSLILALRIHLKMPRIFRKRSQLMILGMAPIHVMVFVLFYWFPGHSIHIWRLSTLKWISLPYTEFLTSLILLLSFFSLAVLAYTTIVYNSFEVNVRRSQIGFRARMKTAGSGMRIFTHSIKNQFIAVRLLAEREKKEKGESELLENILSVCNKTIERLGNLPVLPERISLRYSRVEITGLLKVIIREFPMVLWENRSEGVMIRVDEHYLSEVIRNLIVNSREAVAKRESPMIRLESYRQLNYLVIAVEDNGIGISPEEKRHVFEPFYSTKPSISNWGMGLAFCQQAVEAFGGEISVESQPGGFTRFELYIPEEPHGRA